MFPMYVPGTAAFLSQCSACGMCGACTGCLACGACGPSVAIDAALVTGLGGLLWAAMAIHLKKQA